MGSNFLAYIFDSIFDFCFDCIYILRTTAVLDKHDQMEKQGDHYLIKSTMLSIIN